jgi:hypothetical protein
MFKTVTAGLVRRAAEIFTRDIAASANTSLLLLGRMSSWQVRAMQTIDSLREVEFKVFSQLGEDGIIDWLVERAAIPAALQSFVEFGVENYREANTRFLLQNRGWRGFIMDGRPDMASVLLSDHRYLSWAYDLTGKSTFITRENINALLIDAGFDGEIGLLSIDIDGNDFWVWEAITAAQPVIVVCEYNAVLGDRWPISVPYNPTFVRSLPEYHNLYFGTSIAALRALGKRKGYRFLGSNSSGTNAFFVREDYASRFDAALRANVAYPSSIRESRDSAGQLSFARGPERPKLIANLPLINTETGETKTLASFGQLYSDEWLRQMTGARAAGA